MSIDDVKLRLKKIAHTRDSRLVEPSPPPRYDDVYFQGTAWLNSIDREEPGEQMSAGHPIVGRAYAWSTGGGLRTITVRKVTNFNVLGDENVRVMSLARWYIESQFGRLIPVPNYTVTPTDPPCASVVV